ncbi:MAG TPA: hypothetical protein VFT26_01365, partial [Pyrinomonadaceae bacterium]|nr:hypothetical protein [Pyrinomonadaceae bacterium]
MTTIGFTTTRQVEKRFETRENSRTRGALQAGTVTTAACAKRCMTKKVPRRCIRSSSLFEPFPRRITQHSPASVECAVRVTDAPQPRIANTGTTKKQSMEGT